MNTCKTCEDDDPDIMEIQRSDWRAMEAKGAAVDRLREQLKICVVTLRRHEPLNYGSDVSDVIESACQALYDTCVLHEEIGK